MIHVNSLRSLEHPAASSLRQPFAASHGEPNGVVYLDSPIRVLHALVVQEQSAKISLYDPRDPRILWQVFIGNGQLHFATSIAGQLERLSYLQAYAGFGLPLDQFQQTDYQFLCRQWQMGRLTLAQLRTVLTLISQDALVQVLKLRQAVIHVEYTLGLDPLLMSTPLLKILAPVQQSVRRWQHLQSSILSPLQRPRIKHPEHWHQVLHAPGQAIPRLHFLEPFLKRNFCLYQIAQEMGLSLLEVLPLFQALVQRELIVMRPYWEPSHEVRPVVACIDESLTVQTDVKSILEGQGYKVLSFMDPSHIWTALAEAQPMLLLLDVDYFDGYGFAKALMRSARFKTLPVIALTERQNVINRLWARRCGFVDCLVKPLDADRLTPLVQQVRAAHAS